MKRQTNSKPKVDIPAMVAAYRAKCSGPTQDLWDAADTKFVEALYRPQYADESQQQDEES